MTSEIIHKNKEHLWRVEQTYYQKFPTEDKQVNQYYIICFIKPTGIGLTYPHCINKFLFLLIKQFMTISITQLRNLRKSNLFLSSPLYRQYNCNNRK